MEHAFYWISTFLLIAIIIILGGILEEVKKK